MSPDDKYGRWPCQLLTLNREEAAAGADAITLDFLGFWRCHRLETQYKLFEFTLCFNESIWINLNNFEKKRDKKYMGYKKSPNMLKIVEIKVIANSGLVLVFVTKYHQRHT